MQKTNKIIKISRSKLEQFLECKRCFYLDQKLHLNRPSSIALSLNLKIDMLLKNEFDKYRQKKQIPPIAQKYQFQYIPFAHPELPKWQNPHLGGISYLEPSSNLTLYGAIDDVWQDQVTKNLAIVDYKATVNSSPSTSQFFAPYKRQLEIYSFLFTKNGFSMGDKGYLLYAIVSDEQKDFQQGLLFSQILVPVHLDYSWIQPTLEEIAVLLRADSIPTTNADCPYCKYLQKYTNITSTPEQSTLF